MNLSQMRRYLFTISRNLYGLIDAERCGHEKLGVIELESLGD